MIKKHHISTCFAAVWLASTTQSSIAEVGGCRSANSSTAALCRRSYSLTQTLRLEGRDENSACSKSFALSQLVDERPMEAPFERRRPKGRTLAMKAV
jgi:hypothetical protein